MTRQLSSDNSVAVAVALQLRHPQQGVSNDKAPKFRQCLTLFHHYQKTTTTWKKGMMKKYTDTLSHCDTLHTKCHFSKDGTWSIRTSWAESSPDRAQTSFASMNASGGKYSPSMFEPGTTHTFLLTLVSNVVVIWFAYLANTISFNLAFGGRLSWARNGRSCDVIPKQIFELRLTRTYVWMKGFWLFAKGNNVGCGESLNPETSGRWGDVCSWDYTVI